MSHPGSGLSTHFGLCKTPTLLLWFGPPGAINAPCLIQQTHRHPLPDGAMAPGRPVFGRTGWLVVRMTGNSQYRVLQDLGMPASSFIVLKANHSGSTMFQIPKLRAGLVAALPSIGAERGSGFWRAALPRCRTPAAAESPGTGLVSHDAGAHSRSPPSTTAAVDCPLTSCCTPKPPSRKT